MPAPQQPRTAHSLREAELFLMVHPCRTCQSGPVKPCAVHREEEHIDSILRFDCTCDHCGANSAHRFRIDSEWAAENDPPVINPTAAPSQLIDTAQWLTLYHGLLRRSSGAGRAEDSRKLAYEAALCLDEALKFYEPDNDLPPAGAFFSDQTRAHARQNPERFARQRLLDLRARLPRLSTTVAQPRPTGSAWWRFWRYWRKDRPPP